MLVANDKNETGKKMFIPVNSFRYENDLYGTIEDIHISDISHSQSIIRNYSDSILELADSITKIGLLSPILVRYTESGNFEVVAGNRRLKACKVLGRKKIACYIVDLDDKAAFEASMIENIQRNTLSIIEEGMAFRKYVNEFGWGSESELAQKLSKSPSYVSKRMRLLDLPDDALQLICDSKISVSTGEELLSLQEKTSQSKFAVIAANHAISSRNLRKLVKEEKYETIDLSLSYHGNMDERERFLKTFDNSILALRVAMNKLARNIENVEHNWILHEVLMNHKRNIHSQVDLLIREKRKYVNRKHFFDLNLATNRTITPETLKITNVQKKYSTR
jgi:ParB family chromosome partitioning protein